MSMNIYTTGSGEFLELILNASAMITGSGFSEDLARVGFLIGLLLLSFQAIWNGQGISFHKAGMLFVVYLLLYGPTTTAVIEDTTTNQVRIVDNLPIGPTFIGSVISTVAYNITKTSEQAFSTPTMTNYGLFSSLNTLAKVRDVLRNPLALDSFVNYRRNGGWDLPKSVNEYLTFCTLNPINLRNYTSIDELYRGAGLESVLAAPLISQSAYIYDGQPNGRLDSCTNIQPRLNAAIREAMMDVMGEILDKGFAAEKAAGKVTTQFELQAQIDQSIQSFAMSAKSAQGYTEMSLIQPIFGDARVNALNHWQEQNAALALRESLNHQEIQWAGKGDTFKHYMRPMIAFFEGLLYAMTPFMAFALVLGDKGMAILGKYMVLPLAVALWMPLLSIVNAFTLWYAGAEMQAIFDGYDATSQSFAMLQLLDIDHAISKALGVGGLLAASVPPLALFIVSGSAMVANSIMGQMTQGDKFRSEDVAPRAKEQAPVLATTGGYTSDQLTVGAHRTGATQVAEQISAQQAASALVQSTQTDSLAATQNYQKNLTSAVEASATTSEGRQNLANLGRQVGSSLNLSSNSQYTDAASKLSSLGWSSDQIAAGTFSASVGGSVPFGAAGVKLEDSEQFKQMNSKQQQETRQAMIQLGKAVQASATDQTLFQAGEAFTTSSQSSLSEKETSTLSESLSEARVAQQAYMQASAMQEVYSAGQSMDIKQAAGVALSKGGTREESALRLAEMAGSTESGRVAMRAALESASIQALSTDKDERIAMASIRALNQDGRLGDLIRSDMTPFEFNVDVGDAARNQGLQNASPDTGDLATAVAAGRANAQDSYISQRDMNLSGYEAVHDSGPAVVESAHDAASKRVVEGHDMGTARHEALQGDNPLPQVNTKLATTTPVEQGVSNLVSIDSNNTLWQGVKQAASPIVNTVESGMAALEKYRKKPPGIDE
ncbi:conjugal transfer protein TraG N-terminal domain-containing protein [Stutzerimonas stutzeri]|uniref:Conjugal transfer protein TraG n=1 Tax=Stutzerimonas stutzeri TaxID=316 RepID=A0AA40RUI7_STUST|nr:conjugal transfer protein TraG N-terminal domain-containing protein [Stutzerimonas stutzeri]MBA1306157.1 conjugal transfer protein TraG [Stutzerimonas stutzeri]